MYWSKIVGREVKYPGQDSRSGFGKQNVIQGHPMIIWTALLSIDSANIFATDVLVFSDTSDIDRRQLS